MTKYLALFALALMLARPAWLAFDVERSPAPSRSAAFVGPLADAPLLGRVQQDGDREGTSARTSTVAAHPAVVLPTVFRLSALDAERGEPAACPTLQRLHIRLQP